MTSSLPLARKSGRVAVGSALDKGALDGVLGEWTSTCKDAIHCTFFLRSVPPGAVARELSATLRAVPQTVLTNSRAFLLRGGEGARTCALRGR